jgi:methylaspartate mutase sigma subunit
VSSVVATSLRVLVGDLDTDQLVSHFRPLCAEEEQPTDAILYVMLTDPYADLIGRTAVPAEPLRCLVSNLPSDAHTWSLVTLELLLRQLGHVVINLGSCPPQDLIVARCRALRPDLVVLSTLNGHGHIEGPELVRRIRLDRDLHDLHIVIGGKLNCSDNAAESNALLLSVGFDEVFDADDGLQPFIEFVHELAAARNVRPEPVL